MNAIELKWQNDQKGAFVINEGDEQIAEMAIGISDKNLIVYHTEVSDKLKGQGIAGKLLETMVDYARDHKLKVVALCSYVRAQFERHADQYKDIWNKDWHK